MKYLSVCSGIEAATQAWHPLGWEPVAFSEIEKFPSAVLAHHYPEVPNWGDMTKFQEWPDAAIDLLVGGTPCQSFSVAGLRKGLDDPRGNLALTYLAIAERYQPRWLVWENVPGVLSADGGRAFGAIIGGMVELGYCPAWRVLDAQYVRTRRFRRAVPQRRRRVFVVAHLGDWRRAAAVLFDAESLRGNPAPSREAGKESSGRTARSLAIRGRDGTPSAELGGEVANAILTPNGGRAGVGVGAFLEEVAPTIPSRSTAGGGLGTDFDCDWATLPCAEVAGTMKSCKDSGGWSNSADHAAAGYMHPVAHSLRGEGFDASEDGTGRGTPIIPTVSPALKARDHKGPSSDGDGDGDGAPILPIAFSSKDHGADAMEGCAPTLRAGGHDGSHANAGIPPAIVFAHQAGGKQTTLGATQDGTCQTIGACQTPAVAFDMRGRDGGAMPEGPHDTANIRAASGGSSRSYLAQPMAVRRLTPIECERLQGFPDGFTAIPWRNKPAENCPDGPRYKALGNSMAVNVMQWIGERIEMVEGVAK